MMAACTVDEVSGPTGGIFKVRDELKRSFESCIFYMMSYVPRALEIALICLHTLQTQMYPYIFSTPIVHIFSFPSNQHINTDFFLK